MMPQEWIEEFALLCCSRCGKPVGISSQFNRTWIKAEEYAQTRLMDGITHQCNISIDLAREAMKRFRARHGPLPFEEECRIYNLLLNNQEINKLKPANK